MSSAYSPLKKLKLFVLKASIRKEPEYETEWAVKLMVWMLYYFSCFPCGYQDEVLNQDSMGYVTINNLS